MTINKNYYLSARFFPAVLTSFPMLIFINKVIVMRYAEALQNIYQVLPLVAHLGLSAAVIFLLVQVNRLVAKEIFQRYYFKEELFMPTTTYLLNKSTFFAAPIKTKIRDKIAGSFGITLPDNIAEQQDEETARKIIANAVSQVRVVLKGNDMLLQHNIEYGFWRNLIGGSLIAFVFSIALAVYGMSSHAPQLTIFGSILSIIYFLPVLFSRFIISRYGKYYAKILYEQFLNT